jgi:Bacterial Ig-like domain
MRRTLVLLATMTLVVVASGSLALAASSLNNGNFETGDLTGWSVDTSASGGDARAVSSYCPFYPWTCAEQGRWYSEVFPKEGSYFALLQPAMWYGTSPEDAIMSQSFKASNGDRVSGWAFFLAEDWGECNAGLPDCGLNEVTGQVVIKSDSGTTVATPFQQSYSHLTGGGNSGWVYWEHTFTDLTGEGSFQLEARTHGSYVVNSSIGLDDVKISTLAPDTTKPSTSATRSVEPNAAGWNKENVTVKLNATDNQGGWGVDKITYSASGAQTIAPTDASGNSVDVKLDQEGTTTMTYYATDKAGNVEDQKTLTVKIDKRAPTVNQETNPAVNATGVPRSAKISATFLEEGSGIDRSTLNADTFQVYQVTRSGNVSVPGTISYEESSKTVTFTPSIPLAKATTYQAIVYGTFGSNPGVEDKADNKLYPSHTWRFSTGSRIAL